jgi:serine/threonine protein kinase
MWAKFRSWTSDTKNNTINYSHIAEIGRGGQGVVYDAIQNCDGKRVALKYKLLTSSNNHRPMDEVNLLLKTQHIDNVIRFLNYMLTKKHLVLVFERDIHAIDLFDFITKNVCLEERIAKKVFIDLVRTVMDLREVNVLHGDIKDKNVLINENTLTIKLIDFGAAMEYDDNRTYTEFGGTTLYAPPEWITAHGLNAWSLGCVLYTMLVGDIPFTTREKIVRGEYNSRNLPVPANALISLCFLNKSIERPELATILNHPFST